MGHPKYRSYLSLTFDHYGQVIWEKPVTVVEVPLLADAMLPTLTVPDIPEMHCTVAVPEPLVTMVAITWLVAVVSTKNVPEYGGVDGTKAEKGAWLKEPVAVNTT
jgi:hypothetical protein